MAESSDGNGGRPGLPKPARQRGVSPVTPDAAAASYQDLQARVADQLVVLRLEFQEAIACYSVRVQSLLTQLGDMLVEDSARLSPVDRRSRDRVLQRVLADLDRLDLKPAKGRRRDLKAVEVFAEELSDAVADW